MGVLLTTDFEGASAKEIERLGAGEAFSFALRVDCKNPRYFAIALKNESPDPAWVELVARTDPDYPDKPFRFPPTVWIERGGSWSHLPQGRLSDDRHRLSMRLSLSARERVKVAGAPTLELTAAMAALQRLAERGAAGVYDIGRSTEGRPLRVAAARRHLGLPKIVLLSGEHAGEFEGQQGAWGAFEAALEAGPSDPLARFCVELLWFSNPDGSVHGWQQFNATDRERRRTGNKE